MYFFKPSLILSRMTDGEIKVRCGKVMKKDLGLWEESNKEVG